MKIITLAIIANYLYSINIYASNNVEEKLFYGKKITSSKAIPLKEAVKNYKAYKGKKIVMEAMVDKVCSKKGCWMILKNTTNNTKKSPRTSFRVKFKDYKFFVPLSLIGKKIWVDGTMERKKVSIEDTKHYLEDAGASKEEVAKVTKASFEYSFLAEGVNLVK